jgi:site-specific DNA recombinase
MNTNPKLKVIKRESKTAAPVKLRASVYARYSCVGNSPYSADEQIQRIKYRVESGSVSSRKYPTAQIEILDEWVIKDEAQTGRVTRDGYELIKNGVRSNAFDILLIDDISRTTRDMGDTIDLYEELTFSGVEAYSVSDCISTVDPNAKDLFVFKGYANEQKSKATSLNTIRGLEVRALGGYSTGQFPYGYFTTPTKMTPMKGIERPSHFEIKIHPEKATIVRRIWEEFAEGSGCKVIARNLSNDEIPSPGKGKRQSNRWAAQTVYNILKNQKYVGIWEYRKSKVVKDPYRDVLTQQLRDESEWIVTERPDLRIVPLELEMQVTARIKKLEEEKSSATSKEQAQFGISNRVSRFFFIGLMKCSACEGNLILVSGKSGGYLGCMNYHRQTTSQCINKKTVKMSLVEERLTKELFHLLDCPDTYSKLADSYNSILKQHRKKIPGALSNTIERIDSLQLEISNYDKFIRSGHLSDVIANSLTKAESELKELQTKRTYLEHQNQNIFATPMSIKKRLVDLGEIFAKKPSEANKVLKRVFPEKIRMEPLTSGPGTYRASGMVNLYGLEQRFTLVQNGVPTGIRTLVTSVKGRCPGPG